MTAPYGEQTMKRSLRNVIAGIAFGPFRLWKPLYDIAVTEETRDVFRIRVSNCPFCEVLNSAGLREFSPSLCEGDWTVARENAGKWDFERTHQIGTGDDFCDHTYLRKHRGQEP